MATNNKTFNTRIKVKRDTIANWTNNNPILLNGEIIIVDMVNNEMRFKIGDGEKPYLQLPFSDEGIRNLISSESQAIYEILDNKLDKASINDIEAYVNEVVYGVIEGSIENITNNKAISIRDYMFYNHKSLKTANFSNAIKIGNYSFYKCDLLTSVNIPLAIEIGDFAFKGCSLLESINFTNAASIQNGAFDECINLSSVNLPLVTTINPLTFRYCENLITADLPSVTNIGSQAFYNSGINSLTLHLNTICTLENENAFYFTPIEEGTGYIYVPSNLVESYKNADGWSVYANQIQAII